MEDPIKAQIKKWQSPSMSKSYQDAAATLIELGIMNYYPYTRPREYHKESEVIRHRVTGGTSGDNNKVPTAGE